MLQIMSLDAWSSGVTRQIVLHENTNSVLAGFFFMTYVFASAIIMANVVLAILIDKFLSTAKEIQEAEKREKEEARQAKKDAGEENLFVKRDGEEMPSEEDP